MDVRIPLFFMTEVAGIVMVVGGMWLIYKQKIYIDKESNQPVEVSLPGNLKFKSNYPALALFVLGFFPLIYPFTQVSKLEAYPHVVRVNLTGTQNTKVYPAVVYASAAEDNTTQDGSFTVSVPFIAAGDNQYKILLVANDHILNTQRIPQKGDSDVTVNFDIPELAPSQYKTISTPSPSGYK